MSESKSKNAQDLIDHVSSDTVSIFRINKYQFVMLNLLTCTGINYEHLIDPRYPIQLLQEQLNPTVPESSSLKRGYYDLYLNHQDIRVIVILLNSIRELAMDLDNYNAIHQFIEYWNINTENGKFVQLYGQFETLAKMDKMPSGAFNLM